MRKLSNLPKIMLLLLLVVRIVILVAVEFLLIFIKPKALYILTYFTFVRTPWNRCLILPISDVQKLGLGGTCLVFMNVCILKICVHLPHCTVILRMQGP